MVRGRAGVIGDGRNRKSIAYVENLADFLLHVLGFGPGVHIYNYADKPDPDMNHLVMLSGEALGNRPSSHAICPTPSSWAPGWGATWWRA